MLTFKLQAFNKLPADGGQINVPQDMFYITNTLERGKRAFRKIRFVCVTRSDRRDVLFRNVYIFYFVDIFVEKIH